MTDSLIYLGHPNGRHFPLMPEWVEEVHQFISMDGAWEGWSLSTMEYNMSSALQINDVASAIIASAGPCILVKPVQQRVLVEMRQRLQGRSVVLIGSATDSTDILVLLEEGREQHLTGEPMLPRKFVIALLLLAKLERHQMWGGKNKGYMWTDQLAKGRGLGEEYADQLPAVINDLGLRGLLIRKTSNGKGKYGLNPDCRVEIYDVLRNGTFEIELNLRLMSDPRVESARALDPVFDENYEVE